MSFYAKYPIGGGGGAGSVTEVTGTAPIVVIDGTTTPNISMPAATTLVDGYLTAANFIIFNNKQSTITIGSLDAQTANANGLALVSNVLSQQSASATAPGLINTAAQTLAGVKTFNAIINANGGIDTSSAATLTIGGTNANVINIGNAGTTVNIQGTTIYENTPVLQVVDPLITINKGGAAGSGQNSGIEIEEAGSITGYTVTSASRNSWLLKAPNTAGIATITPGAGGITLNQSSHDPVTIGTANGLSLSTQALSLALSSTSTTGALSSTDWNTFNGKQAAGNYITALTGDATASGPGSVALTLATVNSNVGSFGTASSVSTITVNGKGLITAASNTAIQITESQVTNLVTDLAAKQATITGAATTITTTDLTASRALISNASGKVAVSAVTDTELGYVSGVTSSIQTQLNAKGVGSVTSVAMSVPAFLSVAGSPITSSGTLAVTLSGTALPLANGGTGQTTKAAAFDALSPMTTSGDIIYGGASGTGTRLAAGVSGQFLKSNGTSAPAWQTLPVVNYIANGYADNSTTGWATYANTAGTSPVTGTGGSPSVTISTSASSPLIGTNSFLMAKGASNLQGNGWSYDFTIDTGYQAKALQISANYLVASGTFVAGSGPTSPSDVTVWIYDVTNAVIIQPSSISFLSNNTSIADQFNATFQTASNSTSYRLIFHVGSTSASAYTLKMDNIIVTPSTYVYGTPVTDEQNYTPTITGFGTPTAVDFKWSRDGDKMYIRGKFTYGTTTATANQISLPAGYTIDSGKVGTLLVLGMGQRNVAAGTDFGTTPILGTGGNAYISLARASSTATGLTAANGNDLGNSGTVQEFFALVPITGWSSSVQTSDQTDTRVVSARVGGNPASSSANATIVFPTVSFDTHGAYNSTTGIYTVPVSGIYKVGGFVEGTAAGGSLYHLYKNGSFDSVIGVQNSNSAGSLSGNINVVIGDQLTVRCNNGTDATANCNVYFERVSGPSAIAATELIAASYWVSANFAATTTTPINFDSREFDTHGAVTTSATAWKFTAPVSGTFSVSLSAVYSGGSMTCYIYKNGTIYKNLASSLSTVNGSGTALIKLLAGEFIDIRPNGNNTISGGALSGTNTANINIHKIGL